MFCQASYCVSPCLSCTILYIPGIILNDFADEIILDPKLIAKHYMKTWFFLDLLSSIPMDYIFLVMDSNFSQLFHAGTNASMDASPYWQGDHSHFLVDCLASISAISPAFFGYLPLTYHPSIASSINYQYDLLCYMLRCTVYRRRFRVFVFDIVFVHCGSFLYETLYSNPSAFSMCLLLKHQACFAIIITCLRVIDINILRVALDV